MRARDVFITGLIFLFLDCSQPEVLKKDLKKENKQITKREAILQDPDNVHEFAYPNPKIYRKLAYQVNNNLKDISGNEFTGVIIAYGSASDTSNIVPKFFVAYYLKNFNLENGSYNIDSTKAPA